MTLASKTLLIVPLLLAACGPEEALLPSDAIEVPAEVLASSAAGRERFDTSLPTVLYLHFGGITIIKSSTSDATANKSFIGGGTVPAFQGDQAARDQVVSLVRQLYARYNIQVVTSRPSSGNYDMAVIGGRPGNLGLGYPSGVVGVAPMDCGDKMPRDIAFVFSDSIKSVVAPSSYVKQVAETTAHETAHTYGLPHSNDGCDLMSYKTCSQLKTFFDKTMSMQADSYGQCGMTSMNSHSLLLQYLGTAPAEPPPPPADTQPPTVSITDPVGGARLTPGTITVRASASDDVGVSRVDLLLDGKLMTSRSSAPFEFQVALPSGQHLLRVDAYDAASNKGTASVSVTAEEIPAPPPEEPPPVNDPPELVDPPPPPTVPPGTPDNPGEFGAACQSRDDCASGLCADDPVTGSYCTERCNPDDASCPNGASCLPATIGSHVCSAPLSLGADPGQLVGSCSTAGAPATSFWPLLLSLLLLVAASRRRRR